MTKNAKYHHSNSNSNNEMAIGNNLTASSKLGLNAKAFCKTLYKGTFSYSTVREVTVDNKPVAILYRIIQLLILSYIIGYDIIWNKGYQTQDTVTSTVTTKVKGLGFIASDTKREVLLKYADEEYNVFDVIGERFFTNTSAKNFRIFDTSDYIIPPNEYNSIFMMTNFIETHQTPGICEESPRKANCTSNPNLCTDPNIPINVWSGIPTGRCINSTLYKKTKVCEVNAWCPVEVEKKGPNGTENMDNLILNSLSYTIFIKNDIEFKKFKKKERNILPGISNSYISSCKYHDQDDPYCPVFSVDRVLRAAEPDPQERLSMLIKGGVIEIGISWNCNYDLYASKCLPKYKFSRFDLPFKQTSTASGFNFRFANKYKLNNEDHRDLVKAYGLRFIISVTGQAGKFNIIPLMTTIGAGLGLMGISVILADCVMVNFSKKKEMFIKFKELDMKEASSKLNIRCDEAKEDEKEREYLSS